MNFCPPPFDDDDECFFWRRRPNRRCGACNFDCPPPTRNDEDDIGRQISRAIDEEFEHWETLLDKSGNVLHLSGGSPPYSSHTSPAAAAAVIDAAVPSTPSSASDGDQTAASGCDGPVPGFQNALCSCRRFHRRGRRTADERLTPSWPSVQVGVIDWKTIILLVSLVTLYGALLYGVPLLIYSTALYRRQ